MDGMADMGGMTRSDVLYGIPVPPGRVIGDNYMDLKWNPASLLIYGSEKVIDGYHVRYDIKSEALEIKVDNGIKMLMVNRIESLIWYDSLTSTPRAFVNGKGYTEDGVQMSGLLEVVQDGKVPLIKKTTLWVKRPDYIPAFDVGNRDEKIYKRENFYYAKGKEVFEIKRKKDLLAIFGDKSNDVEEFIKINRLNVKEEYGLQNVFEYYNSQFQETNQP